jgi:hypothetical protein
LANWQFELAMPPEEPRERELWLQHAIGFMLFADVRGYAIERIDPALSPEARAAAEKGIDDAVYGLMMVMDGVTGSLSNSAYRAELKFLARLINRSAPEQEQVEMELDLANGDGMCMGFHGWLENDFGTSPVVADKPS